MQNPAYPFITPSSTCLSEDLLFFDTFSHPNSEKEIFDLVQFPTPVVIDLIKIVPLGQPIEAKIPGNVRLGATNPSKCELEFFINDLTKQDAHTMTDLGKFYCSEKDTDFSPPIQIQTDGLLLRGSYRTLTLAIFGQIASYDEKGDEDQVLMSASSPPAQTPASPVASERDITPAFLVESVVSNQAELSMQRAGDESESYDGSTTLKSGELKDNMFMENDDIMMLDEPATDSNDHTTVNKSDICPDELSSITGEHSSRSFHNDKKIEHANLSNHSNDADAYRQDDSYPPDDLSSRLLKKTLNTADEDNSNATPASGAANEELAPQAMTEWTFNIESYQPKPLTYFADPSMTLQERSLLVRRSKGLTASESVAREVEKLQATFKALNCPEGSKTEEWVTLVEDLTNEIANMSLNHTVDNEEMLKFLVSQVEYGLDFELALRQKQTGFKVRHMKAGIKLATILFHCGPSAITTLLEASIPHKMLSLYHHSQMPLRLLIFKCLNAVSDSVEGLEHMISHKYHWENGDVLIERIKRKLVDKNLDKDTTESNVIGKNESKSSFDTQNPDSIDSLTKSKTSYTDVSGQESEVDGKYTCYQIMVLILLSQPSTRITISIGNLIKKVRLYTNFSKLSSLNSKLVDDSEDSQSDLDKDSTMGDELKFEEITPIAQDIINLMKDGSANLAQPVRYLPARVQYQVKPNPSDIYLSIYKWLNYFKIIDVVTLLIKKTQECIAGPSNATIEEALKLQAVSLLLIQQIVDSPRGSQLFLSADCCNSTHNLLRTMSKAKLPNHLSHIRITNGAETCFSSTIYQNESLSMFCCHDISLRLSYFFKVFSCIDKLFHFHRELLSKQADSTLHDPEKVLHQLYIISGHPYGLEAIVKHFSCIGNLDCLLRFLDMPEYHKQLEFVKETSIDYTLELVGTFFRLNNNVLEMADEYLDTLVDLCKTKDKTLSVRIKSLLPWLSPFDTDQLSPLINYSEETFRQLTRVIRKSIPNYSIPFAKGLDFELPPQLITAVRILRQLCISPQVESFIKSNFESSPLQKLMSNNTKLFQSIAFVDSLPHQQNNNQSWNLNFKFNPCKTTSNNLGLEDSIADFMGQIGNTAKLFQPYNENICGDLKYHYGLMLVFEQEGLKRLLNTLRELTGNYPRPIYQSAALSGFRGRIVISYIHSVIILLHSIVCHLIDARGSEFKDTSVIPVILETYSLLCFVPKPDNNSSVLEDNNIISLHQSITLKNDNYQKAQTTKKLILSILLSYTQMCLSVSESEEKVISKSMWTKMLKEVIDFTLSTPVLFEHSLDILTKILPPPLPCSSMMDSIDQEQLFKNINHRKIWSAHLHPLHQQIEQMISSLSICYQSNIRTLLTYLCNQLCDLSSTAACMVSKILLDTLVSNSAATTTLNSNDGGASCIEMQGMDRDAASHHQESSEQELECVDQPQSLRGESAREEGGEGRGGNNYSLKMILNLISNCISNQSFETAFINHLQVVGEKDEKILINLHKSIKCIYDGKLVNESTDEASTSSNMSTKISQLVESIKAINSNSVREGCSSLVDISPPEELTKINLIELARRTSDRFPLLSSLKKTFRLKVLMDLNSCALRNEFSATKRFDSSTYNHQVSAPVNMKPYAPPPPPPPSSSSRRNRSSARPDSFRSRPQNTSRPPSIHVDDFNDLYGESSQVASSASRFAATAKPPHPDYRAMNRSSYQDAPQAHPADSQRHSSFFVPPSPSLAPSGSPYSTGSGRSKSKYMKMK